MHRTQPCDERLFLSKSLNPNIQILNIAEAIAQAYLEAAIRECDCQHL